MGHLQDKLEEEKRIWTELSLPAANAAFPVIEHDAWLPRVLLSQPAAIQVIEGYQIVSGEAGCLLHNTATYLSKGKHMLYVRYPQRVQDIIVPEHTSFVIHLYEVHDIIV